MTKTRSSRLMLGGGTVALAMALLQPATVHAQTAFQGVPTVVTPGTAVVQQGPVQDTITVLAPEAVINWRINNPPPGNYVFLPQGRTGRFVGFNDFVVLNRILPGIVGGPSVSRLIELNGTITSEIDLTNQNAGIVQGGSVWFYSAGGILVGGSAVINVGSLVLTSNDINTTGGLFGPGGEIRFVGNATSGAVTVSRDATINARDVFNPGGSYVALVAPRVVQGGTIDADGSTALVAAQAAEITINTGLFDIRIQDGTDDPNGIVHTGTTGGPTNTSPGNQSRVYMVAVPRNTAIEMLLSGTVGFQTAGVSVTDGAIVISAGRDILGGVATDQPNVFGVAANVRMGDLVSLNGIDVTAEGDINVASATTACNGCRILDVNGSANLTATNAVQMRAGRGQVIQVAGDLTLRADNNGEGGSTAELIADRSGPGAANAALNGGQVNVFGNLRVDARGLGVGGNLLDGAGQGGFANLLADGGEIIASSISVDASGFGNRTDAGQGAAGTGGDAVMTARNGGIIRARSADVRADGIGGGIYLDGQGLEQASDNGGIGSGGRASVRLESSGQLILQPFSVQPAPLTVSASGSGSVGRVEDGDGTGGSATVVIADPASLLRASSVDVRASGVGGVNRARNLNVTGITGGDGIGGFANVTARGTLLTNTIMVDATGSGSSVAANPQFPFAADPTGGNGTGGSAAVSISGTTVSVADIGITAEGYGGNARGPNSIGGTGAGGLAGLSLFGTANLTVTNRLYAYAFGGGGAAEGTSGDGIGGSAFVSGNSAASVLRTGFLQLYAHGIGGGATNGGGPMGTGLPTPDGGDGVGGSVAIFSDGLVDVTGAIEMVASGSGGTAVTVGSDPRAPQGGTGTGGVARLVANGGTIQAGTTFLLDAAGIAVNGANPTGNAFGGQILIEAFGGGAITSGGDMTLFATAESTTGAARAGRIDIAATGGRIATTGVGVLGATTNGFGANSSGGLIRMTVGNGPTPGLIEFARLDAFANGTNAGRIELIDNATGAGFTVGSLLARANGAPVGLLLGGSSGILVESTDGAIAVGSDVTLETGGDIAITANGSGGLQSQVGSVTLRAGGNINGTHDGATGPTIRGGGAIDVQASGLVNFAPGTALIGDGLGRVIGGTGVTLGTVDVRNRLTITATTGDVSVTAAASGEAMTISGANVTIGAASTAGFGDDPTDIVINATGNVTLGTLNSADSVFITGSELRGRTSSITADQAVNLNITNFTEFGSINAGTNVLINTGFMNAGTITAGGTIDAVSPGDILLAGTTSGGTTTLNGRGVRVQNALTTGANSDIILLGSESAGVGTANAVRDVRLTGTSTVVNFDAITAGRDAILNGNQIFATTGTLNAGRNASLTSPGLIWVGSITGAAGVTMTSGDFIIADAVRATGAGAAVTINAANNLRLGSVSSDSGAVTMTAGSALIDSASGGTSVTLTTVNDANVTNTQSGGTVTIRSTGGGVSAQTVNAGGAVALTGAGTVTSNNVTSTGSSINVTGGVVGVGTANAATTLTLQSGSNVSLTSGTSGGTMTITGTGVIVQDARTTGAAADIVLNSTTLGTALGTATAGRDIRINSADFIQLFGAQNAGRDVILAGTRLIADGQIITAARAINATTTGNVDFGNLTAGSGITIASGGRVRGDNANSTGAGSAVSIAGATSVALGSVASGGSADLRSTGGGVAVTSATTATTLTLNGAGDVSLTNGTSGGTASLAGVNVTVGTLTANGAASDIAVTATQTASIGTANAGRDLTIAAAVLQGVASVLTAGHAIGVVTTGGATFGTATAASGTTVTSGGAINGQLARTTGAGGNIALSGATGVTLQSVQSAGTTALIANAGKVVINALRSTGAVTASGQGVNISGGAGPLDFTTLLATAGDAIVNATTGNLTVTSGSATGALTLTTQAGNLDTGTLTGGTISLTSSGTATLGGATTATGALGINSAGNAAINAVATGTSVQVRSGNIAIGTAGRLGTAGTTTALTLSNTDTSSRTFVGGADVTTGYSLSAAEMLRLFGTNITINAPRAQTQGGGTLGSNRPPDVVIGAFTLQGGATAAGNLGANGTLTIDTPGSARVNGAVALEGMSASNRFVLNATEAIEVIAGTGSIRMSNGGALSGIIDLRSDDIAVATSAAISAIAGLTDIDLIDDRLSQSDGVALDEGMLAAGGIRMTVRNGVYIQNTGTGTRLANRRGFTTGADGLTITTAGPATRIVINGQILNAAGTQATGRDTIPLIRILGAPPSVGVGQFDQGSTANGCLIANPGACFDGGDNVPPVQDVLSDTADGGMGETPFALLIELRDMEPLPGEPLIDDPVTGTGNDDLWEAPCEPAEGEEACP